MSSYKLAGMEELLTKLDLVGKQPERIENQVLRAGAEPIKDTAFNLAPIRTGKGRMTIKVGKISSKGGIKGVTVGIHKEDHKEGVHMYYQEFGTSRHIARPFLRPAFESQKRLAYEEMKKTLKAGLGL